ncbi:MAG: hypothetical protein M1136_07970 [Chloroflexi bacterium]|nr:hypothetical protein [Chloroflexota bacterium]MCL5075570.1 hypothetical protein [Chloroflexota bacterium]
MVLIVVLLIFAATCLMVARGWLILSLSLALIYLGIALLFWQTAGPHLALVKLIAGATVTGVLALTGFIVQNLNQRLEEQVSGKAGKASSHDFVIERREVIANYPFVLMTAALAGTIAYGLAMAVPLGTPGSSLVPLNFSWYWLLVSGLLTILLSRESLKTGFAAMVIIGGADLLYSVLAIRLEQGYLLLSTILLVYLSLAFAYLSVREALAVFRIAMVSDLEGEEVATDGV